MVASTVTPVVAEEETFSESCSWRLSDGLVLSVATAVMVVGGPVTFCIDVDVRVERLVTVVTFVAAVVVVEVLAPEKEDDTTNEAPRTSAATTIAIATPVRFRGSLVVKSLQAAGSGERNRGFVEGTQPRLQRSNRKITQLVTG
jgi:hypothetical protein